MNVSVWDTYVKRQDGKTMHFDILVLSSLNKENIIFNYGKEYLKEKSFVTSTITSKECNFCHVEPASDSNTINEIEKRGFSIIEMENCN